MDLQQNHPDVTSVSHTKGPPKSIKQQVLLKVPSHQPHLEASLMDHHQEQAISPNHQQRATTMPPKDKKVSSYNIVTVIVLANWSLGLVGVTTLLSTDATRPYLVRIMFLIFAFNFNGVYLLWVLKVQQVREYAMKMVNNIKSVMMKKD